MIIEYKTQKYDDNNSDGGDNNNDNWTDNTSDIAANSIIIEFIWNSLSEKKELSIIAIEVSRDFDVDYNTALNDITELIEQ